MQDTKLTTTQKIEELKKIRREFSKPFEKKSGIESEGAIEKNKRDFSLRVIRPDKELRYPKSCREAKFRNFINVDRKQGVDGQYYIEMEDDEGIKHGIVDCDMTTDGGGWTKVKHQPLEKVSTCGDGSDPYNVGWRQNGWGPNNYEYICSGWYTRLLIHPFPKFQEIRGVEVRMNKIGLDACGIFTYNLSINGRDCTSNDKTTWRYTQENIWQCLIDDPRNIEIKHKVEAICQFDFNKPAYRKIEIWMGAGQGKIYVWVR